MEVPWTIERCIVCLTPGPLTEEHLIPQQIGGKLWARCLCKACNDRLGDRVEGRVRNDPAIQAAARTLATQMPALAKRILDGVPHIACGPGGAVRGRFTSGTFTVDTTRTVDGAETTISQPTPGARRHIASYARKYSSEDAEAVVKKFDDTPDNQRVELVPGLAAIRRPIERLQPAYDGPLFSETALLKIAYEFLACHLSGRIYDESLGLAQVRAILRGDALPSAEVFTVDSLTTREYAPVHGLALVDGGPPAIVKIYLFGWLVFRVNLHRIGIRGPRHAYMCRLDTGEEDVIEIDGDMSCDVKSGG